MRALWAFDISVRPGSPMPLNPDVYMDKELPGVPGRRLPLSLKVREDRKALIEKAWKRELAEWQVHVGDSLLFLSHMLKASLTVS